MPRRNRNATQPDTRFHTTDSAYGYAGRTITRNCPSGDCLYSVAADSEADAEGAIQAHLAEQHKDDE